ncbi:BZ3500_MvSof-1268-A1-R1_Chr2-1g04324 [Microbotryum saponariae]|uniref:BZ3500_MvSof-1268-A1-R1_Chr2-1g04324 protein n=1 Tax=Microbotryum saponariae TaxID=289078 RepID=A0A2X0MH67_9BASI|nr:BZ3500_MvSof-1268-A1-R1_Chr2-1g04324 [Microbotryum saponariae]SCZ91434.1 BZ3501_MvSof-1269-A2-R1_Chr2-1g03980 [Microbotryum saponariae]
MSSLNDTIGKSLEHLSANGSVRNGTMSTTTKVRSSSGGRFKNQVEDFESMTREARDAQTFDHNLTMGQAIRLYKKGICWSLLLSMAIIMEGYGESCRSHTALLPSFFGFLPFVRKYGKLLPDGTYGISAPWQSGLSIGAQVGSIAGVFLNGWLVDRFGYKKTMIGSLLVMIGVIFIPFFAPSIEVLFVGCLAQGVPWGVFSTLACAFASEVCCTKLRPILTTWINACWVIGQLIATGVLRGFLGRTDQWAYRVPYALQWFWPVIILTGCIFIPESPWYLARKGRDEEAVKSVRRLTTPEEGSEFSPEASVKLMSYTNKLEESISAGISYIDCFKGIDRRRTEIACTVWSIQNLCGSSFMGYSAYFLQQAGFSAEDSFNLTLGQYALGLVGTCSSWILMSHAGRRNIYTYGLAALCGILFIIGFMGIANSVSAVRAVGAMLLLYTFIYDLSVGPVCYSLVAEMSSTRLRAKTVVLARNFYNLFGIVNYVIMPRFLNPEALDWGPKTGFFYAGFCFLCTVYCYFRLPEPKGRSFGELDVLFEQGVSARKFSSTHVDPTSASHSPSALLENFGIDPDKAKKGSTQHHEKAASAV